MLINYSLLELLKNIEIIEISNCLFKNILQKSLTK